MNLNIHQVIKKNWLHILIWVPVIVFLFWGPKIVSTIFVSEGKPVQKDIELPAPSTNVQYSIDLLQQYDKQGYIFEITGWSFIEAAQNSSPDQYSTEIVLSSKKHNLVFATEARHRLDVVEYFSGKNIVVKNAGFSMLVDKNLLNSGAYLIGLLVTNKESESTYYTETNKILYCSPNQFYLSIKK